jgi:succinylglutamic semialdehyde dehydrogenase
VRAAAPVGAKGDAAAGGEERGVMIGRHLIGDAWAEGGGTPFVSTDPATGQAVWHGRAGTPADVDAGVSAARGALEAWEDRSFDDRGRVTEAFAEQLKANRKDLAELISLETGKPLWESGEEVAAMIGKVALSVAAAKERRSPTQFDLAGATAAVRFKPHGVLAVFGPFNFPGHLPNGHIVPALLAGNTVVFKPSELTPSVAQKTAELWPAAGLPAGVLNLVHGGRDTGAALAAHDGIDGLLFTGSVAAGVSLHSSWAQQPHKILALEMGGNNPLVAWEASDLDAAAYVIIQSAFMTAGQRCSCARRLILPAGAAGDALLDRLAEMTAEIEVGDFRRRPEPFMGPVISERAAAGVMHAKRELVAQGATELVEMRPVGASRAMLRPGIVDVTTAANRPDEEIFGPLLQVIRVPDFDAAIAEANNSRFGLAAGLLSDDPALWEKFRRRVRAGVVNWNRPTTGASGRLPFGGVGLSGNHRPSGYFAADYCSYPVASLQVPTLSLPTKPVPGIPLPARQGA